MRGSSLLLLAVLVTACVQIRDDSVNNHQEIESALSRLLSRTDGNAFVILEHKASGKFVQFAGSKSEPLLLDLPRQALNSAELERAMVLFRGLGSDLEESPILDRPGGEVIGTQSGFQLKLGQDTKQAADLALRIFAEVFQLPRDSPLSIEEN